MAFLHALLVILHVATGAAWFGLALRLGGQARAAGAAGGPTGAALAADGAQSVRLMTIFLGLTLAFAVGALLTGGGFTGYGPTYHTAIGLLVALLAVQLMMIVPGWNALKSGLDAAGGGAPGDPDEGTPVEAVAAGRARVAAGVGVGHLLWLAILLLMFWPTKLGPALGAG